MSNATEPDPERRYSISEVAQSMELEPHILRQWESKITSLRPRRTRSNRRYYTAEDIRIIRRVKQLTRYEKMTLKGANVVILKELRGEGRPKTKQEVLELIDRMQAEVRAMLDLLGPENERP